MTEQTTRTVPQMRTAEQALAMIRAADPDTAVSLRMIRRSINTGAVPHVDVGKKKLVNMAHLYRYLEEGELT